MEFKEFYHFLEYSGKDPSRLIFEDELTAIYNRRFLLQYLKYKVQWGNLDNDPLSLLMLDVDHFKEINDTHGHDIGDQALIWVANLLKKVSGEGAIPIRYAGDEFIILIEHSNKQAAINLGEILLKSAREDYFHFAAQNIIVGISFSIGVASAPENAKTGKELIQQADVALYYAKKNGRDILADASEINQEAVFPKTAIYKLDDAKLVGRTSQLSQVTVMLNKLKKQNQFGIVEGPNGIGKTEFLETIRRHLAEENVWSLKINGDKQEMFRPYYLAMRLILELFKNVNKEYAQDVLGELNDEENVFLAQVFPNIHVNRSSSDSTNTATFRAGIFETLVKVIIRIIDKKPLILLVDDMHLSDEATLMILRKLFHEKSISLFICGAQVKGNEKLPLIDRKDLPLNMFRETYQREMFIQTIALTPLTNSDVQEYINGIFPDARIPKNFSADITRVSHGNPLFLSEILRKMVLDSKITLIGHQWVISTIEKGYLPESFEEVVGQKIAALDEESRLMLDHVSALGEDVSLSMITGTSRKMEAKVLEFIEKAKEQGLLSAEFQSNDDMVRFLGERIYNIVYGTIAEERRQKLHEEIGAYQETLYQENIIPSAAPLAYHFERSANKKKAENYGRLLTEGNQKIYNLQEAADYSMGSGAAAEEREVPLNSKDIKYIPDLIRDFIVAVRNINFYPPGSDSIVKVISQCKSNIDRILVNNDIISIMQMKKGVIINGQKIDISKYKQVAETFLDILDRFELKGIAFHKGLNERELEIVLHTLGQAKPQIFDEKYWENFSSEKQLEHIDLKQMRYAIAVQSTAAGNALNAEGIEPLINQDFHESSIALGDAEKKLLPDIMRSLLGNIKAIKLYPIKSEMVINAVNRFVNLLNSFFARQKSLTFGRAGDALLVNGEKVDILNKADCKSLMTALIQFLDEVGVDSLTFLEHTSAYQMEAFLGIISDINKNMIDKESLEEIAKNRGLTAILFNRQLYEVKVAHLHTGGTRIIESSGKTVAMHIRRPEEAISSEDFDDYLNDISGQIGMMYFNGHFARIEQALELMFSDYDQRGLEIQQKVIEICQSLLTELTVAFQLDFAKLLFNPVLGEFDATKEPILIAKMGTLLNRMVAILIQFMEYRQASRILFHLHKRYREFKHDRGPQLEMFSKCMEWKLEPTVQQLLIKDLQSSDSTRQVNAAQLLASLGFEALPLLIDIIKGEEDHRARQTAASLIRELGLKAIERLKRLLVLDISPEERRRILEVIDTTTTNVRNELVQALEDENPEVRQAACELAERLGSDKIKELLMELAGSKNSTLATSAIKCLGTLNQHGLDILIIDILNSTKDGDVRIACCRALGQIGKHTCIEPLAKVLKSKGFFFFRKPPKDNLRAVAAFALKQIPQFQVTHILSQFVNDRDPAVREIARSVSKKE
ncbi:MAG: diguanylate cyclase [bacterium]